MFKHKLSLGIFFLIVLLSFGFTCEKESQFKFQENIFSGDSTLAKKTYFENLTKKNKGYSILKKQNESYQKNYLNFKNGIVPQLKKDNLKLKFEKQFLDNGKKYRIVFTHLLIIKRKTQLSFIEM